MVSAYSILTALRHPIFEGFDFSHIDTKEEDEDSALAAEIAEEITGKGDAREIKKEADELLRQYGLVNAVTLQQAYNDDDIDCCEVQYIAVESPDLFCLDAPRAIKKYNMIQRYINIITPEYTSDDSKIDYLSDIAKKLSEDFEDVLFMVEAHYYVDGNEDDEVYGEYRDAYINGCDMYDYSE